MVKNSTANAGDIVDMGSIRGLGASPEEGNSNPTILFIMFLKNFSSCYIYIQTHTQTTKKGKIHLRKWNNQVPNLNRALSNTDISYGFIF